MMATEVVKEAGALDAEKLVNALRMERAKNKVLLDEVLALEDELVNRQLDEYGELTGGESREFWRGQLLANRVQAEAALKQLAGLAEAKDAGDSLKPDGGDRRRPLHNRAAVRPVQPGAAGGSAAPATGAAESKAAAVRNRAHELKKAEGIPFPVAFRRAEKELLGKVEG
jgi:hypothetical protein